MQDIEGVLEPGESLEIGVEGAKFGQIGEGYDLRTDPGQGIGGRVGGAAEAGLEGVGFLVPTPGFGLAVGGSEFPAVRVVLRQLAGSTPDF